jgi:hypothetical protein
MAHARALIVDFAQYTQLIARRVREAGVYSEIVFMIGGRGAAPVPPTPYPLRRPCEHGGHAAGPQGLFWRPCARHLMASRRWSALGGGRGIRASSDAPISRHDDAGSTAVSSHERAPVWMSHGDRVTRLPPGFRAVGISTGALRGGRRRFTRSGAIPSRRHTEGRGSARQFRSIHRRTRRRPTMACSAQRGRTHPRASRRQCDLRARRSILP